MWCQKRKGTSSFIAFFLLGFLGLIPLWGLEPGEGLVDVSLQCFGGFLTEPRAACYHRLRALLHLFPAGLILPAFTLRMWATGREGEGRAGEGGGGAGEGRKTRWEEKEETLNVLNEMPAKGKHSKLICKTQGSIA